MIRPTNITTIINPAELIRSTQAAITGRAVEAILGRLPIVSENDYEHDPENPADTWQEGKLHWLPVGGDPGNAGRIKLGNTVEVPIGERVINSMEGIIELERQLELLRDPNAPAPATPREAAQRYFDLPPLDLVPTLTENIRGKKPTDYTADLSYRIKVRLLREAGREKEYTIVVEDDGIGQTAARMHKTLLSLGSSEKKKKGYLIGVFGQGGSSAFDVSEYSWLVSRRAPELPDGKDGGVGWTVVKHIIMPPKYQFYAYLAAHPDGRVPALPDAAADAIELARGTRIGHIGYKFAKSDHAYGLFQSLNHLLFNPVLPFRVYTKSDRSKSDIVRGNGYRFSTLNLNDEQSGLDKRYSPQIIEKK
jgi:hypothetical protein